MKALVAVSTALAVALVAGATPAATAPERAAAAEMELLTLTVRQTRYGRILFDGRKRVLYAFTRDGRGGPSRCYGACAKAWPVYFAKGTPKVGNGVKRALLGTTRRRDGRRQMTYNGRPLYYYAHEGPLEVRCQNVDEFGGLWLVVRPDGTLVRGG